MFDIGFAELLIIGVVALLVIGPERLPEAVRTASAWVNRIRRGFNDIKQEVQQELHNDAVMRDLRETGDSLRRETDALRSDLRKPLEQLTEAARPAPSPGTVDAADSGDNTGPNESVQQPETERFPSAAMPGESADSAQPAQSASKNPDPDRND